MTPIRRILPALFALLAGCQLVAQVPPIKRKYPFVSHTELGGLAGRVAYDVTGWTNTGQVSVSEAVENKLNLTLQTFNGVQVRSRLAVGGLIGIDWYTNALIMPVGAGLRYDLARPSQKNVRLFALADVGYGLIWLNKATSGYELNRGGLMLNPGLGLRLGKPDKGAFTLTVSYKRQVVGANRPLLWNDIRRDESRVYNRLAVRLGISF